MVLAYRLGHAAGARAAATQERYPCPFRTGSAGARLWYSGWADGYQDSETLVAPEEQKICPAEGMVLGESPRQGGSARHETPSAGLPFDGARYIRENFHSR